MTQKPRARKNLLLVGSRIRKLRKERNLTQSELASKVGIQQSDLCRMETGEYKVSLETLFRVLSVFEMNIAEFFQEHLPTKSQTLEGEIFELLERLGEREKKEVRDFLLFKVSQKDQKEPKDGKHHEEKLDALSRSQEVKFTGEPGKRYGLD